MKALSCLWRGCLQRWDKQSNSLIRQFTVSCLARARALNRRVRGLRSGSPLAWIHSWSPLYPASAMVFSLNEWRTCLRPLLKILVSGHLPARNGPWTQTIFEDPVATQTSYLSPGPLSLCDHQLLEKGAGSQMGVSVPSVVVFIMRQSFSPSRRSSEQTFFVIRTSEKGVGDDGKRLEKYISYK